MGLLRIPTGGDRISAGSVLRCLRTSGPRPILTGWVTRELGAGRVTLHRSGREALRTVLCELSARTARSEVIVPAYTCPSVAAAAVAAGLRVRLVDTDTRGWVDGDALKTLPIDRCVALVVGNLFGVPEPVDPLLGPVHGAGAFVIDDAAQALGGSSEEGSVGGRGDVGILSFGIGKPLCALGGGAAVWTRVVPREGEAPPGRTPRRILGAIRAVGWDVALLPAVFRLLSAIPMLHVGESPFDAGFARGPIDGASLSLAAAQVGDLKAASRRRAAKAAGLARRLRERTRFTPLEAPRGSEGVYPRLATLAPSAAARSLALKRLRDLGASRLYPTTLDAIEALRPHLVGATECPGARELASRLLTLPTYPWHGDDYQERVVADLERIG